MAEGSLARLIHETDHPRLDTLRKVARALRVPFEWLANGKGTMFDEIEPLLGDVPGFDEAFEEARKTWGDRFPEEVWDGLSTTKTVPLPKAITHAADLYDLATVAARMVQRK